LPGVRGMWTTPSGSARDGTHIGFRQHSRKTHRNEQFKLLITSENDVLRDEGEAYARRLADAFVRVTCTRYIGTIHDFVMLNAIADTPAARGAVAQAITALRAALG
jgi:alpha/beta hydrolase fold